MQNPMVEIVSYYGDEVISASSYMYQLPAVIKCNKYLRMNKTQIKFSRKNLFLRDKYLCQYCSNRFPRSKLTYDHVIPKSKWNSIKPATSWENIVTACYKCNRKKANKTPQEAGMKLLHDPKAPSYHTRYLPWFEALSNITYISEWSFFISKDLIDESGCKRIRY
jgi:5-methylcytosine-specific restriction endonuclease McrA